MGLGQGMSQACQQVSESACQHVSKPAGRSGNGDLQGPKQPDRIQICKKVLLQVVIKP
jgi:hypothetical protein